MGCYMRFLIQRVKKAAVSADKKTVGIIEKGLLVFIGISQEDTIPIADKLITKLLNLRIFEDQDGKTNLALKEVNGSLLLISQFTLYADCKKGNRPSFTNAGTPEYANELYKYIVDRCLQQEYTVQKGIFGANMEVSLVNDGPFTVMLDSTQL